MSNRLTNGTNQATAALDPDRESVGIRLVSEPAAGMERLGFGLSKLMRIPSRADRQRLLDTVYDQGIRHFDVARMYGLGASERELGTLIRSKRTQVTVATKFGIEPALATR
ncbi:MAG: aldo/keto reductase, partial [Nitrospira sp.]